MAKKSTNRTIDLSKQNLSFTLDNGIIIKLLNFNPVSMNVEVNVLENGQKVKKDRFPFAHLPKNLKKILNPI
jgi:hypothetical protein